MVAAALMALAACLIWGFLPLLWAELAALGASATEVLAHRVLSTFALAIGAQLWRRRRYGSPIWPSGRRARLACVLSGAMVSSNWLLSIWTASHGQVIEASLGFFIAPLLAAALGIVVLGDRPRPAQRVALGVVALGVLAACVSVGRPPLTALALAALGASYTLIRKVAPVEALAGMALETLFFVPPAVVALISLHVRHEAAFGHGAAVTWLLLGAGLVTGTAITFFIVAARRLPLIHLGALQYTHPVAHFLVGLVAFHEVLAPPQSIILAAVGLAAPLYLGGAWAGRRADTARAAPRDGSDDALT